jgi:hypothetical protein
VRHANENEVEPVQKLKILQSMWSMERRAPDGREDSLEDKIAKISDAGFDGISARCHDRKMVRQLRGLLPGSCSYYEGQCFVGTVDELKPVLEIATEFDIGHIDLQPDIRPRLLAECIPILEGWQRLAEDVDFPVLVETHRDRMTTDLFFTLDILDEMPDLRLLADLSHYLVGREFAWPISAENHGHIDRILQNSWAFHGRVASREQVQIELSFVHHRQWLDLFKEWWLRGFQSWRSRAAHDATLPFACELGPQPYAIAGADGYDLSDRWAESLQMKDIVSDLWAESRAPN